MNGIRILESIGTSNENTDAAAFNNFLHSNDSVILKDVLNECKISKVDSTTIKIDTGVFLLSGFQIRIEEPQFFRSTPTATETTMALIARIELFEDKSVSFSWRIAEAPVIAKQQPLFKDNVGVFEDPLGYWTIDSSGIKSYWEAMSPKTILSQYAHRFLPSPESMDSQYWRIPRVKPGSFNQVDYLVCTSGTGGNTVAIRETDGSLKANFWSISGSTTPQTLVNYGYITDELLPSIRQARIRTDYIQAGESYPSAISQYSFGMFVIKGGSGMKISVAGTTVTTEFMIIWKYQVGNVPRSMYLYKSSLGLSSGENEQSSDVGVSADSNIGSRIISMPMSS